MKKELPVRVVLGCRKIAFISYLEEYGPQNSAREVFRNLESSMRKGKYRQALGKLGAVDG